MSERLPKSATHGFSPWPESALRIPINQETKRETLDVIRYEGEFIAHNAALNPEKFQAALQSNAPHIEIDLTDAEGRFVVAHEPQDFLRLPYNLQELQDPYKIVDQIREAGKHPFLDVKDEAKEIEPIMRLLAYNEDPETMVSSNNHDMLMGLRESGFEGKIFFSIGWDDPLRKFLRTHGSMDFSDRNFGVSIEYSLLSVPEVAGKLKKMGLTIAAWKPNTPESFATTIQHDVDFITSDNFSLIDELRIRQ